MNIYIYDDKKGKTEIIEIEESKFADNPDLEFFNDNDIRKVWHSGVQFVPRLNCLLLMEK